MLQIEERADFLTRIVGIDQDCASLQQIAIPFQNQIDGRTEQGLARTDESG